jgi:ferredoxin-nitrate reductase
MTDRVADIWGTRTPHPAGTAWPVRVDQYLAPATPEADVTWYQSACVLCSNGCGMDVGVLDGRIVGVRGALRTGLTAGGWARKGFSGGRRTMPGTG